MFPNELKQLNQWVCVKEGSKIPFTSFDTKSASSTNPKTWSSYQMAKRAVDKGLYDGLGFVFNDNGYVAIDIDKGFEENGEPTRLALEIINTIGSYTEISRSGRGFHIIVKGNLPFKGRNNLQGVEIYKTSRYFIMTGNIYYIDEITENQQGIDIIVDKFFKDTRVSKNSISNKIYEVEWEKPTSKKIKLRPNYPIIDKGMRNNSLLSLGSSLLLTGYQDKEILKELRYVNKTKCIPPLTDKEVILVFQSVKKYKK